MSALRLMPAPRCQLVSSNASVPLTSSRDEQSAQDRPLARHPRAVLSVVPAAESWRIYTRDNALALAAFATCAAAMAHARTLAARQPGSELRLFDSSGRLASREIVLAVVPAALPAASPVTAPPNVPAY